MNFVRELAESGYEIKGEVSSLPGELDLNFLIRTDQNSFILKISRKNEKREFLDYQVELLHHLNNSSVIFNKIQTLATINGEYIHELKDEEGDTRYVRMLNWVEGRLWSSVNPHSKALLFGLGNEAGRITSALEKFDHPVAHRYFEWIQLN